MRYPTRLICLGLMAALGFSQVAPDPKLRANRDTYNPVMEILKDQRTVVTDEQLQQLKRLPIEAVWGILQGLGYTNCYYSGLKSTQPNEKLVGRALTIRYLPKRPDLIEAMEKLAKEGDWPRGYHARAAEQVKPGDVIVVDLGGGIPDGVFFGDVSALAAKVAGASGAVLYGSSRDLTEIREIAGFPVLAVGFDPHPATQIGVDWNIPIRVGSVTVLPGDVVLGDEEAVVFFPPQLAAQVIQQALQVEEREDFERAMVQEKKYRFRDVYGTWSPEVRRRYEERARQ